MDAKMYQRGALVTTASLVLLLLSHLNKPVAAFNIFGQRKNSWPQFIGRSAVEVKAELETSSLLGAGNNVFIQEPYTEENFDLSDVGTFQDVWLHTDDNHRVYETPRRGLWHPNRVSPGWPELVGKPFRQAIEAILREVQGLTVSYGPAGFNRIQDFRSDRVWLDVDDAELVAITPKIG